MTETDQRTQRQINKEKRVIQQTFGRVVVFVYRGTALDDDGDDDDGGVESNVETD